VIDGKSDSLNVLPIFSNFILVI